LLGTEGVTLWRGGLLGQVKPGRTEPPSLDFLGSELQQEGKAKRHPRINMALKVAHFPSVRTREDSGFRFPPPVVSASSAPEASLPSGAPSSNPVTRSGSPARCRARLRSKRTPNVSSLSTPKLLLIDELG
jgi:hypothetical protein